MSEDRPSADKFSVALARIMGLGLDGLYSFSLKCEAGKLPTIEASYHVTQGPTADDFSRLKVFSFALGVVEDKPEGGE